MTNYSQAGQDLFVLGLINSTNKHYFLDIGCWVPDTLNNTLLLEQNGWNGISIDITDLSEEWKVRNSKFVASDALIINYTELLNSNNQPMIIDYLNIDIEGSGFRYQALKRVMESNRDFKIITIEHDAYRGYSETERTPQRALLTNKGYVLLCSDVCLGGNPFEDWWINPKYFKEEEYKHLMCSNTEYNEILNKLKTNG